MIIVNDLLFLLAHKKMGFAKYLKPKALNKNKNTRHDEHTT